MTRKRFPWARLFFFVVFAYVVGWMLIPMIKYMINH